MEITVNIPADTLRIREMLKICQELAQGQGVSTFELRDALDAAALQAGRCVSQHALVSIEESQR